MDQDVARAILALSGTQHLTLKAISILMGVVSKSVSDEEVAEVVKTIGSALDSFDEVLEKTRAVINKATHG